MSSSLIEVFNLSSLSKQIKENPEKTFLNVNKGSDPKPDARSSFHPITINVAGYDQPKRPFISIYSPVSIYNTPKDPSTEKREPGDRETNGFALTISSKTCPELGAIAFKSDLDFHTGVTRLKDSGDIKLRQPQGISIFNTFYSPNYSQVSKKKDTEGKSMAGKPREDPLIKIKGSFDKYPERHPLKPLQNTVKTVILDYRTKRIETVTENGKTHNLTKYDPATVNGQPVDAKNIHLFITQHSRLMEGSRLLIEDSSNSAFGMTLSLYGNRLIIDPGQVEQFSDERMEANAQEIEEYNRIKSNDVKTTEQQTSKLDNKSLDDVVAAIQTN